MYKSLMNQYMDKGPQSHQNKFLKQNFGANYISIPT